jgi:hypothetical protein
LNVSYLSELICEFIHSKDSIVINNSEDFDKLISEKVEDKSGVYIWENDNNEVIYIGKSGIIRSNQKEQRQTLRGRLQNKRGGVRTSKYIVNNVFNHSRYFNIYIYYSKEKIPATYIEALLLFEYYKSTDKLPRLNKSF